MFSVEKALVSVQAYLPSDNEITTILKICKFVNDPNDWKLWNNSDYRLFLTSDRRIRITEKSLKEARLYDLFILSNAVDVVRQSSYGLYDDASKEFLLLGNDNILREFCYTTDGWKPNRLNILPLSRLRCLMQNADSEFNQIKTFYCGKLPCNQINSSYPECLKKLLETTQTQ